ncbi:putative glycosyl hydrolase [Bacillus sp. TS-2]|nr:putative glycosyl hydrolase [Bacillus sp. TS-2]
MERSLHTSTINPVTWAEKACESLMNQYEPIELPPRNRWHYHQGVFLYGMYRVYEKTNNQSYFQYMKKYVDDLVDENGNFYFRRDELDAIQAGLLLFPIYKETGEEKYRIAAFKLRNLLNTLNKTEEGGFWHKDNYAYQTWLDGLYMAGPFSVKYGQTFNEPELVDLILLQERLMRKNTYDSKTGLYFHAYDEKASMPWVDPETKCSKEIWGRSLGWYAMALIDIIEDLQEDDENRKALEETLRSLLDRIIHYQDSKSHLWYQIVDKGSLSDNWLESSASCLFIYAIAKSIRLQVFDKKHLSLATKAFEAVVNHFVKEREDGSVELTGICIGTSAGEYDYYIGRETSENDLHGVGAFCLAAIEVQRANELN